jgi:hypothetical protein
MSEARIFAVKPVRTTSDVPKARLIRAESLAQVRAHILADLSIAEADAEAAIEITKMGVEVEDAAE